MDNKLVLEKDYEQIFEDFLIFNELLIMSQMMIDLVGYECLRNE